MDELNSETVRQGKLAKESDAITSKSTPEDRQLNRHCNELFVCSRKYERQCGTTAAEAGVLDSFMVLAKHLMLPQAIGRERLAYALPDP